MTRRTEREERRASEQAATGELEARYELRKELIGALDSLNQSSRETILLRYFEGLAPRDIARRQGAPLATVKTRLRRGLGQLREELDQRYNGDRATWMSAFTALAVPVGGAAVPGTLAIGGIAMGTMMKLSAAAVAAAACVYLVVRTPASEPTRTAAVEPPAGDVELAGSELAATDDTATEGVRQSLAPQESSPAVLGGNVLRVVLEGIAPEAAQKTTISLTGVDSRDESPAEIGESWSSQGATSEFDLDPFFASAAERGLRVNELEVEIAPPLHLLETARVPLSRGVERENGQTVFEVRVAPVPAAVLHGRLTREDGDAASEGLVGALLLDGDFPVDDDAHAVECEADGTFELRVPASGPYALASYEEGRRPTTTRVEALVGTRVDVGTLALERGHAIKGYAMRAGEPLTGASIAATPPTWKTEAHPDDVRAGMHASVYEGRDFNTSVRSVHLLWLPAGFTAEHTTGSRRNGRFELGRQRAEVDATGAFAFSGLGSGEYLLRVRELAEASASVPGYWDDSGGDELHHIHGDRPAVVVRAPEHGVEFEFRWTSIRFELAGDLESGDAGRLLMKTPSGHPTPVDETGKDLRLVADPLAKGLHFAPPFYSTDFSLSADEPAFTLQAPPKQHILGEVEFPGRQPVPLDFWTPESGEEVVVPIQLVHASEQATLVIELENPPADTPETFAVQLWRDGLDEFPPDTRPVDVADGQLRLEGIFPGKYCVCVWAGEGPSHPGLFFKNEFELELRPARVSTQSILMRQGAGLHVTVRGENGELVSGEYELFDHLGGPTSLVLKAGEGVSSWKIYPYGMHESTHALQPGSYRLVLRSPGYAERNVAVELRAGEYEVVDVTLTP